MLNNLKFQTNLDSNCVSRRVINRTKESQILVQPTDMEYQAQRVVMPSWPVVVVEVRLQSQEGAATATGGGGGAADVLSIRRWRPMMLINKFMQRYYIHTANKMNVLFKTNIFIANMISPPPPIPPTTTMWRSPEGECTFFLCVDSYSVRVNRQKSSISTQMLFGYDTLGKQRSPPPKKE